MTELSKEELQKIQQQNVQDALDVLKEKGLNWEAEILASTIEAQAKELERLRTEVEAYEIASLPAERREIENEQLRKELKRKSLLLEHALELIEDREKEIEEMKLECDVHKDAMGIANQAFVDREEEIEQLRKERDELKTDCQEWDRDYGALEHANIDNLAELEQLRQERDEVRKQLWEATKALEFIIVKTGNEPFNVQFIVKPLRDAANKALSHIQGKENTDVHDPQG